MRVFLFSFFSFTALLNYQVLQQSCNFLFWPVSGDAVLSGAPVNTSALLGSSASFTCGVTGTQQLGEDLQLYKVREKTWRIVIYRHKQNEITMYYT